MSRSRYRFNLKFHDSVAVQRDGLIWQTRIKIRTEITIILIERPEKISTKNELIGIR